MQRLDTKQLITAPMHRPPLGNMTELRARENPGSAQQAKDAILLIFYLIKQLYKHAFSQHFVVKTISALSKPLTFPPKAALNPIQTTHLLSSKTEYYSSIMLSPCCICRGPSSSRKKRPTAPALEKDQPSRNKIFVNSSPAITRK